MLTHFVRGIEDRDQQFEEEVEPESPGALRELAKLMLPPFTTLRAKRHLLERMAKHMEIKGLLVYLGRTDELVKQANDIDALLFHGEPGPKTLENARELIRSTVATAEALGKRVQRAGERLTRFS